MSDPTFKRGQVEWALWRAFTQYRSQGDVPPQIFRTRIKRLLDLDRDPGADATKAASIAPFAFVAPVDGSGVEAAYAPFDVFCLGLALDLLDVGFKQSEIVYCQIEKLGQLDQVPAAGFTVACFPVKVKAASAGWTRAVVILDA